MAAEPLTFATLLSTLEAAGETTRLRLLALLAEADLTVSELVTILGQSQPRISRHLKLLVDADLVLRHREGAWAFFHLARQGPAADLAVAVLSRVGAADPVLAADRARLADVRSERSRAAARYFADHARQWDTIRSLHVAEERVEAAIRDVVGDRSIHALLDLGTGTGRVLELLAPLADRAVGVDASPPMLALARARLDAAGLRNAQLRQGDLYALPVERNGFDLVTVHQVLHYLDDPARALREAARTLRPAGRLVVVDFAPHTQEFLRADHAHRRLGFARGEIDTMLADAGLDVVSGRDLGAAADTLTVSIWVARDRRIVSDALPLLHRDVA